MRLLFIFVLFSSVVLGQEDTKVSGFIGNGVMYTYQYIDVVNDIPLTELDTIRSEFKIAVSETNKFITLSGVKSIDSTFSFDTIRVENLMERKGLGEKLKSMHFSERREFEFEVDYVDQIVKGGYHPTTVKWMYDESWNSLKLHVVFAQNGRNYFYNFYLDEVVYLDWKHGLTYSKEFTIDEYGETDSRSNEEIEVFKEVDEGTFIVNDTSLIINTEKLKLEKILTRCFNSPNKDMYFVNGAMFSIPKNGKWIFYSFDYDKDRGDFDGYYYFGIKEE